MPPRCALGRAGHGTPRLDAHTIPETLDPADRVDQDLGAVALVMVGRPEFLVGVPCGASVLSTAGRAPLRTSPPRRQMIGVEEPRQICPDFVHHIVKYIEIFYNRHACAAR